MKNIYKPFVLLSLSFFIVIIVSLQASYAQLCPDGSLSGGTAFDTTISFPSGVLNRQVKFAQFDPQNGMVTCVKLCVTIKGVIDSVAIENYTSSPQDANYTYKRRDTIRGPGISSFLTSTPTDLSFGPYPLDPFDGVYDSGLDLYTRGPDTVLTSQLCSNISDSTTIAQFYGTDSVTYNYSINASATGSIPGGSGFALVRSSALVNFHFEYCTCPAVILPINIYEFNINRLTESKVDLKWSGFDEIYSDYYYEAEVSRDGNNFTSIGILQKNNENTDSYKLTYTADSEDDGIYYFRVKQVYSNGYVHYSNIKHMVLKNSVRTKFSIYPNPSTGIVGIKFDNSLSGYFNALIYTTQGQMTVNREIVVKQGSSYMELARLVPGVYWLRLTDKKSLESSVHQLLIK